MGTTALIVEVLVIGAITEIWITLFLWVGISPNSAMIGLFIEHVDKLAPFLIIPFLAITYIFGWIIIFITGIFTHPIQLKYRKEFFQKEKLDYDNIRGILFQNASDKVIDDFRFDRHMLRISSSNIFNFFMIAISVGFFLLKHPSFMMICMLIGSIVISILSLFQWRKQYHYLYIKSLATYKAILQEKKGFQNNNN